MEAWMADGGVFEDRQQFWRDHVAGWKSSGLSLRLYSEQHGLKAGTLGYWNSRPACCTDVPDGVGGDLFRCSGSRLHAAQIQRRPSPPYCAAEATRDELVSV
ncbi:IS66 family insertion sequence element accessory protein TnpA [Skermanella aerolata]|uniref:IS66 family insertion sequence element accessory protein TnpA n=1 Tax=Skermanella aerolata TaxID=393310 RepID=UPI003D1DB2AD